MPAATSGVSVSAGPAIVEHDAAGPGGVGKLPELHEDRREHRSSPVALLGFDRVFSGDVDDARVRDLVSEVRQGAWDAVVAPGSPG